MRVIRDLKPDLQYDTFRSNHRSLGSIVFNVLLAIVVMAIIGLFATLTVMSADASTAERRQAATGSR
jgi:hypothetical protein